MNLFSSQELDYKLNPNDVVFTPLNVARTIIEIFKPEGFCLDPCMGHGAFFDNLPAPKDWCEITKGRNFYDYNKKVDWIVTNPPYSDFNSFLEHSFELADNVLFLVPVAKVWKSWGTMMRIKQYGGIKKVWFIPASRCGFPFGFPCGAFHFVRNYTGNMEVAYAHE